MDDDKTFTYLGEDRDTVTSVLIPNDVTSIRYKAFVRCSNLLSVTIPRGVISIEYGAFSDCLNLTSIIIPDGVTAIKGYAFDHCVKLSSIVLPNSVTSIGGHAFYACESLKTIRIPDGVDTIRDGVFGLCSSLLHIILHQNVNYIAIQAFHSRLTTIKLSTVILRQHSDVFGVGNKQLNSASLRIKIMMEQCIGIDKENIKYEVMDLDIVSKLEYMLWLMAVEMSQYIDDWEGPHSLLMTGYLLDI